MSKKIFSIIMACCLIFSLVACDSEEPPTPAPTPGPQEEINEPEDVQKRMIVDTEEYSLVFDILGSWAEYAGNSEIRESAKAVLTSTADNSDNVFFYLLIEKYDDATDITMKDKVVNDIKARDDTVEFESISDSSSEDKVKIVSIYSMTTNNSSTKNYQYTTILDGYEISFVYSAPSLVYNSQKGYINDMIDSVTFTLTEEPQAEEPVE